jgi:hypothetical protein
MPKPLQETVRFIEGDQFDQAVIVSSTGGRKKYIETELDTFVNVKPCFLLISGAVSQQ